MNLLRTTHSIVYNAWGNPTDGEVVINHNKPVLPLGNWDYQKTIDINQIKLWEQLHHEKGSFGLFVSWQPYIECYMLMYYPFLGDINGIKVFYGENACYEIRSELKKLEIDVNINRINVTVD